MRPYNNNNIVTKPVAATETHLQQSVDEEKSNAAKWMIGLTATAAIAIGGLYLAKRGKLGEGAEKWAKKLFGEGAKGGKVWETTSTTKTPTSSTSSTSPSSPTAGSGSPIPNPIPAAITVAPLIFARKGIGKLIKKPSKTLTEIMSEFEQAGVKLEKKGENLLEIRTGKRPGDITQLHFTLEGVLSSIQRTTKKAVRETFSFENKILSKIEREIPTPGGKPLEHIVEFAENGKVKAKKFVLNDGLRELPVNSQIVRRFKSEDIVEAYIPRTSKYFNQAVEELEFARKEVSKFGQDSSISVNKVLRQFYDANNSSKEALALDKNLVTPEKITEAIKKLAGKNNNFEAEIVKLIQRDMGNMKHISNDTLIALAKDYSTKLKTYKITNPEHVAIVGKPLKECSYDEFETIIREVAPDKAGRLGIIQDPFKDHAQEEKTILFMLERLTGRSNINNKTTLLEILQDL